MSVSWLLAHPWVAWLLLALLLGCIEFLSLDLIMLMLAVGGVAGAFSALIFPDILAVQAIVAVVVSALMLFLVRPELRRRAYNLPGYRSQLQDLLRAGGVVTTEVDEDAGEVSINGQIWRARPIAQGLILPIGSRIEVNEIDGATLIVSPSNR